MVGCFWNQESDMICVRCGADNNDGLMRVCIVYKKKSVREYYKHRYKTRKVVIVMAKGKNVKKEVKKAPKAKAGKMGKGKKAC
jgi:hypothetical protein